MMDPVIDHLHQQAMDAITMNRPSDYERILSAYREAWQSLSRVTFSANQAHPRGRSAAADVAVAAIDAAMGDELEAALAANRFAFARLVVSDTYSMLLPAARAGDTQFANRLIGLMLRACVSGMESGTESGWHIFDYSIFRLRELAKLHGYSLTDRQKNEDQRRISGHTLQLVFERLPPAQRRLLEADALQSAVDLDQVWADALPSWRLAVQGPVPTDRYSAEAIWFQLLQTSQVRRVALLSWLWLHPSDPGRTAALKVAEDLEATGGPAVAFGLALARVEEELVWWLWWLYDNAVEDGDPAVRVRVDLLLTLIWLTQETKRHDVWQTLSPALAPFSSEVITALNGYTPPEFGFQDGGEWVEQVRQILGLE